MNSLWDEKEAKRCQGDPVTLRVYTSRLLGREPDLVLQGGGNTSVKVEITNPFGESEAILLVKGSGGDLATLEASGLAPVKLDVLKRMAQLDRLSDAEMVRIQRGAMTDPSAPNPSVEAILHALIPYPFVDHTHADAVVAISNSERGEERIREIYGERVLVIPYVMPGFVLAREIRERTRGADWERYEGMILLNHGVFTFGADAKTSYERMIRIVTEAEVYLEKNGALKSIARRSAAGLKKEDLLLLARMRRRVSELRGTPVLARLHQDEASVGFASLTHVASVARRGPITPDHVIRTKGVGVLIGENPEEDIGRFARDYRNYFERQRHNTRGHAAPDPTPMDPAPRYAIWPGRGTVVLGATPAEVQVVSDILRHTMAAIQWGESLGGWRPLGEAELFDVEYWTLEQAKLAKRSEPQAFRGKVALVTGAASGIGRACVEDLNRKGASVIALDINPVIRDLFTEPAVLGLVADLTHADQIEKSLDIAIRYFGGLDILISNAGIFPATEMIADMKPETWSRSLAVNLSSHLELLQKCIPYLRLGLDPAVVMIASKNVVAPGPGASAYSVAKAGLAQLARVAALELGAEGIRVNVIHPHQVFDTAIWTPEVLEARARFYHVSVEEYKKANLLKKEITSRDVAELASTMAGPVFSKTTGAQIAIDGGQERVI